MSTILVGQSYLEREDIWVRSKLESMTLDEKIGQLFIVRAFSRGDQKEIKTITEYITKNHIGGICFFQGSPTEQARLVNTYQKLASTPLFIAIDGEWGLGMRYPKESISFPKQLMLGAIQDNKLIYEMGREIARQCKKAGINLNFAPSVDINNNPANPVILDRSFGELPQNVTAKGYMYMKAMEDEGIMACIKHFPGHGDTDTDSHKDLPILNHTLERLNDTEFYPFRRLASQGALAMMVGHLHVPSLDNETNRPASLSGMTIKQVLREEMSFHGLLITDAMDMKGITKYYDGGIAEAEAFLAGNDVILLPQDLNLAIQAIKNYISLGKITKARLDESIERILRTKYKIGLNVTPEVNPEGIAAYLNRNQALGIKQKLIENAITLVSDYDNLIPLANIDDTAVGTLAINVINKTPFQKRIDSYLAARHFQWMPNQSDLLLQQHIQTMSQFDKIIISIHTTGKKNDFSSEISDEIIRLLQVLQNNKKLIVVVFGNPYLLKKLDFANNIILSYNNESLTQDVTAQSLFGVNTISGTLPVSVHNKWSAGHGLYRDNIGRLGYCPPEMVGLNSDTLKNIDVIMEEVIKLHAAPGGQVLIAKEGKIVFQKAYGKLTPDGYYTTNNTIYDIASVTKILATTIAAMKLVDDHKLYINHPLRYYITQTENTDKAQLTVEDIMAHHAGLLPGLSFYEKTTLPQKSYGYNPSYYSGLLQDKYTIPVARGMFMRNDYKDTMYQMIWNSKLKPSNSYKYSDLGFYIMQKVIENQSGMPLDQFTMQNFYKPLGLKHTMFRPLLKFPAENIAPTEIDNYFRMQTLQGYVHDMGAAMMGGVSGHAGLFSTAADMAVIMQMLLNKGNYGGKQYLRPETIELFTTRHPKSTRRALGFDMKETDSHKPKSMSDLAPVSTFGHTGFTGTAVWADPVNKIVYVFVSNRTYPGRHNQTFNSKAYRNKIQTVIYKAQKGYTPELYL